MTTTTTTAARTRRPSRRLAKIVSLIAIPAAVAVSGLVVAQASYSAYSATAANLKPGATGTKCLVLTSTGSLASTVKLYATTPASTKNLAANINLTITQGTGGSFGSCTGYTPLATGATLYTGTLDGFGSTYTGYATGLGSWAPTGTANESRTYQITYTVNGNAPDTTQGGTASLGLTFEAQNN